MNRCSKFIGMSVMCLQALSPAAADVEILRWQRVGGSEYLGTADFDKLLSVLVAGIDIAVSVKAMPAQRMRRAIITGDSVCLAPVSLPVFFRKNPNAQKEDFHASSPIEMVSGHIFSRPGEDPAHSLADLAGKSLAYWWRMPVEDELQALGIKLEYLPSEKEAIQLMMAGRVDFTWGWRPDSLAQFTKITGRPANFDPDFSMVQLAMQIVCKKTAETRNLLKHVDRQLAAMRGDGRLKKILGPHARVYGLDVPFPAQ